MKLKYGFLTVLCLLFLLLLGCARKQTAAEKAARFAAEAESASGQSAGSPAVTAKSLALADGCYTADVTLAGGSGRASVASPAKLTVADGAVTAKIVWSSSNYDYMLVDGVRYEPVTLDGGSVFEIPVAGFDWDLPVTADTVAMSQPHEISYTLRFLSASLSPVQ